MTYFGIENFLQIFLLGLEIVYSLNAEYLQRKFYKR